MGGPRGDPARRIYPKRVRGLTAVPQMARKFQVAREGYTGRQAGPVMAARDSRP
jgi:hypothetical protein